MDRKISSYLHVSRSGQQGGNDAGTTAVPFVTASPLIQTKAVTSSLPSLPSGMKYIRYFISPKYIKITAIRYVWQHAHAHTHAPNSSKHNEKKICALLEYYPASCSNCLPMFRDNVSASS
jgi:hypothetical protein